MTESANSAIARNEHYFPESPAERAQESENASMTIEIMRTEDMVGARLQGRLLAQKLRFTPTQTTLVATVISELARNMLIYAGCGQIVLTRLSEKTRDGLQIEANDNGPGIENIAQAMSSGYSSSGGLGLGLSGIRQMVDDFEIQSEVGSGTQVKGTMWSL